MVYRNGSDMSRIVEMDIVPLATHKESVRDLLDFLPVLYPDGSTWLVNALDEVTCGGADGFEASSDGKIVGILLGRLKSDRRYKIRTLFVSPDSRGRGLGRTLLRAGIERSISRGASSAYITFAHTLQHDIAPLLETEGFEECGNAINRYGLGRHEVVYERIL